MRTEIKYQAGFTSVGMAGSIIVCIVLAAVAIPNWIRAREAAKQNSIESDARLNSILDNLRLFEAAKEQWANEHKKIATDHVTTADLLPFSKRGALIQISGEIYATRTVSDPVTATLRVPIKGRQILTTTSF